MIIGTPQGAGSKPFELLNAANREQLPEQNPLSATAVALSGWMERWFPDAFVFVVLAVILSAVGALLIGAPVSAFPIDRGPPDHIKGKPINNLLGWFLTYPFNMTGNPAISVPCGMDPDGLPMGMQLIGRRFDDALVLRASRAFEKAQPWRKGPKI
jgi:Asp-tRNA(Asn)/Glu-tRNA(Gln) amidotransferase A subunit family amidase